MRRGKSGQLRFRRSRDAGQSYHWSHSNVSFYSKISFHSKALAHSSFLHAFDAGAQNLYKWLASQRGGAKSPVLSVEQYSVAEAEEPEMIALLIALAIACVAFWRLALKILAIAAVFLLVCGIIHVIQYLHHIK